jgi:hypothetical protein
MQDVVMCAATVTAVMGDNGGGGVDHVVRSEIDIGKTNEAEMSVRMKSAVSTATSDVANMVVISCVITVTLVSNFAIEGEKK